MRWLRRNADLYSIDPDRLAISGDSSGGHVALLLHVTDGVPDLDDIPDAGPFGLGAAVAFYAPTNLDEIEDDEAVRLLLGGHLPKEVPALALSATPASYVSTASALSPVLLVHGTDDPVVPVKQSVDYARALSESGHAVELVLVQGGGHGMWPSFFSDTLADAVDTFLGEALNKARKPSTRHVGPQ